MPDWLNPRWRQEGRTGPGPIAPRYASSKDRNTIRKGKQVDSNPGGPGGRRRKIQTNKPQGKTSHRARGGGGGGKDNGCAVTALTLGAGTAAAFGPACWAIAQAVQHLT